MSKTLTLPRGSVPVLLGCVLVAGFFVSPPAAIAEDGSTTCLECHSLPDQSVAFKKGEAKPVTLDTEAWAKSVHSAAGFECATCHGSHEEYPHPELKDGSGRDYAFRMSLSCKDCHEEQVTKTSDGVHLRAIRAGNPAAAVCTDCHDPHTQTKITGPNGRILPEARLAIPNTCARCHTDIYKAYRESAHGQALTAEGNADVPTCIDCHGVHSIADPRTARFRLDSPRLCASCHTDKAKMARYGLSTEVLDTYVADFHGTTVTLFQKEYPGQATNKPVCYDCHGIHSIPHTRDPEKGLKVRANLLRTCQQCHPTAASNFPDAWLSHYIPSPRRTPLVYWSGWFYRIVIPGTIGGMLLFVSTDFLRRRIESARRDAKPSDKTEP